ncbi:hypothetical protein E1161_07315 [Saccharopolyspora aridisoli]|uniref:Uncharacterized protein n=1 Tax=Saccharopolyspora aridisoli TaxID=2530385 RepID=A0A4R4UYJ9_9PSEU|nr:hypothetical protein E1161_07315 [Saccharopolyspora aridisoli]
MAAVESWLSRARALKGGCRTSWDHERLRDRVQVCGPRHHQRWARDRWCDRCGRHDAFHVRHLDRCVRCLGVGTALDALAKNMDLVSKLTGLLTKNAANASKVSGELLGRRRGWKWTAERPCTEARTREPDEGAHGQAHDRAAGGAMNGVTDRAKAKFLTTSLGKKHQEVYRLVQVLRSADALAAPGGDFRIGSFEIPPAKSCTRPGIETHDERAAHRAQLRQRRLIGSGRGPSS